MQPLLQLMRCFAVIATATATATATAAATATATSGALDEMWLRQPLVSDAAMLAQYRKQFVLVAVSGTDDLPLLRTAAAELGSGLSSLLGRTVASSCCGAPAAAASAAAGTLLVSVDAEAHAALGAEGFSIGRAAENNIVLSAKTASGALSAPSGCWATCSAPRRCQPTPARSPRWSCACGTCGTT